MEPVDDSTGLQIELGGQLLNGFRGGIRLLLVSLFQGLLLFRAQHNPGLLQVLLSRALGALHIIWPSKASVHTMAITQGAQPPLHVSWKITQKQQRKEKKQQQVR